VAIENTPQHSNPLNHPPGSWRPFRRGVQRILAPVEHFLAIEAASGTVLMAAAFVALAWANSPWRMVYSDLWHISLGVSAGTFTFDRDLRFWINDGLMTIFFFVVGLEIRREVYRGELSELRRAALPLAAAIGGMLVPALTFFAINSGRPSVVGWAVPMATDIAFAVGALALLGKKVTPALRILLLALAVIDDVGAIIVIAMFYSADLVVGGFAILGLGILVTLIMQFIGIRSPVAYIAPGTVIWTGAYIAGIHPTLAGVVIGFMTPVRAWYGRGTFLDQTETGVRKVRSEGVDDDRNLLSHLGSLSVANREAVSPVERLQHTLHGWVAFGIMPLFAFANAGVAIGEVRFQGDERLVFWGIILGLMIGKPIGIVALAWLTARAGLSALPSGVRWSHVSVVGMLGGIGFTMALFIAQLAFSSGTLLETAKLGILCGSGLAGICSIAVGYRVLTKSGLK
jgi:NhaA family Na+:H+ antiporter